MGSIDTSTPEPEDLIPASYPSAIVSLLLSESAPLIRRISTWPFTVLPANPTSGTLAGSTPRPPSRAARAPNMVRSTRTSFCNPEQATARYATAMRYGLSASRCPTHCPPPPTTSTFQYGGPSLVRARESAVFYIYRDYHGILIVFCDFILEWGGIEWHLLYKRTRLYYSRVFS